MATAIITDDLATDIAAANGSVIPVAQTATNATGNPFQIYGQKGSGSGAGGGIAFVGAQGGATGAGGAVSLTGGPGGSTSGAGGTASLIGGAGTAGNGNGAAAYVTGGAPQGSGTSGQVVIDAGAPGAGTAAAVAIAPSNASKITLGKPLDLSIGGSTAAAGSVTGDATVLPAGTASVYPTTAADDARGVRISSSDLVTGRILFIGNGVSNKILKVYPVTGGTVNGASADVAFSSASGKGVIAICLSSGSSTWLMF